MKSTGCAKHKNLTSNEKVALGDHKLRRCYSGKIRHYSKVYPSERSKT